MFKRGRHTRSNGTLLEPKNYLMTYLTQNMFISLKVEEHTS